MSQSPDSPDMPVHDKLRVLVVDDEPTLRLGFAYALSNRTTAVETAANGRVALARMEVVDFDVMILDLRMPELDGLGVITTLRRRGNKIPIILCSAALTPNSALAAIRHGVVDFLLKPVRPDDLRQVVEFVTRSDRATLPRAMRAARAGQFEVAVEILEATSISDEREACWLAIFKAIRDEKPEIAGPLIESAVQHSLAILAFNAPKSP